MDRTSTNGHATTFDVDTDTRSRFEPAKTIALAAGFLTALFCGACSPDNAPRCPGQRFTVEHVGGGAAPYLRLAAGRQSGAFLIDYGATASTLSADAFGRPPGGILDVSGFDLPTFPNARFGLARYDLARVPYGGQLGVVGTDFLSLLTTDLAVSSRAFGLLRGTDMIVGATSCDAGMLERAGMVPIRQAGFFSSNPATLSPGRVNVPVLYLRIGPVVTWAQIDTGYDDIEAPPSIDINDALFQRLTAAGVPLTRSRLLAVSTCSGIETREVYSVAGVEVVTDASRPVRRLGAVNLVRKVGAACGGIAGLAEPAAQVSASVVAGLRRIVLDPRAGLVWVAGER